jgi:HlyD family secretion protein
MKKHKIIIITGVAILVIVIVLLLIKNGNNEEGIAVRTAKVNKQKIVETVSANGMIQPQTKVKISADVAAKIIHLDIKEGDWVEKGRLLVQLDREQFQAELESAQANLRASESNANLVKENMNKVEKDYLRMKELFNHQLESQAALDQANAAYLVEKARHQAALEQVDQARAILKQTSDALSKTTIYAPMAGTISELNKEEGEIALGSQFQEDVIMVISNLSGMEALVDMDENDVVAVQLGDSATIEVDALPATVFKGTVSDIASSAKITASGTADQKTEFEVKIAINNPGQLLRPGMTAGADIVTEIRDSAVVVPIQCVSVRTPAQLNTGLNMKSAADSVMASQYIPDKDGFVQVVFVVKAGEVAAAGVKTGIQSETHIEIIAGLAEGDEIVVGNYRAISQLLQNHSKILIEKENNENLATN